MRRALLLGAAALMQLPAHAAVDQIPRMGHNMPLYTGKYATFSWLQDERDRSYDAAGNERGTATPQVAEPTAMPMDRFQAEYLWHFPMFETYGLPYFSSRTHFARVQVNYIDTQTQGGLIRFAESENGDDGDFDEADDLRPDASGIGDIFAEYGAYLYGSSSRDWRSRERTPFALLWAFGGNLPFGVVDRDAPNNAGTNTTWLQARIGVHANPWRGGFLAANLGHREYFKQQDSLYGGTAPRQQGDDRFWNASASQRLFGGLYLSAFALGREGDPNQYKEVRYVPNPPPPPDNPNADKLPAPGNLQYDNGTERQTAGLGLDWFLTQRVRLGLHYEKPMSGRSGEFDLQYVERTPAGCTVTATGCNLDDAEVVRVDGTGPARIYATERLMFSINVHFGLGDNYSCTGCSQ